MPISTLSDLSRYIGHHDVFHTDDWFMNPLTIINVEGELYESHNGFVSDVTADVEVMPNKFGKLPRDKLSEVNGIQIRVKVRKPWVKIPTLNDTITQEMDVIYFYDDKGNYSCSEIRNRFALIKEGLENGTIEMPFYGVALYEENPDWMRVTQRELIEDPLINKLTQPEPMLNLPLNENLERKIIGILNSKFNW